MNNFPRVDAIPHPGSEEDFSPVWEFRFLFDGYDDDMVKHCLTGLCEGAIRANLVWFAEAEEHGEGAPCCLSNAGVTYVLPKGCGTAPHPCQTVRGAQEILERKTATCIDIACYVAAQLRMRGGPASVVFENMRDKHNRTIPGQYHALVQTPQGILDYTQDLIDGNDRRCSMDCIRPFAGEAAQGVM